MKARIIVAAICVPVLFVIVLFFPPIVTGIVVGAIAAVAALELLRATKTLCNKRVRVYALLSAALIPICASFAELQAGPFLMLLLLMALFAEAILAYRTEAPITLNQMVMILFAGGVIPFFLSSLVTLKAMEDGRFYVLVPIIIAFLSDAGAYFIGMRFGRHKLLPKVSPKKTIEGSLGGFAVSTLAMLLYCLILKLAADFTVNLGMVFIYGITGSAVCQLGDMAFSLIKREYEIKDFGDLLPGHGGMLDRFDSMVFLAPFICALTIWLPVFY